MGRNTLGTRYQALCKLLVAARKGANLSQMQVAKRLDRPQSYVSRYETGERRLDVIEFLDIAKALRQDPIDLLRRL